MTYSGYDISPRKPQILSDTPLDARPDAPSHRSESIYRCSIGTEPEGARRPAIYHHRLRTMYQPRFEA